MSIWEILAIIIGANAVILLFLMGWILYSILLVRTSKKKWVRGASMPEDPEYAAMFREGERWRNDNALSMREVTVKNGRLHLAGQYYDFGFDKAVIILPGRTETCYYSAFFAEPYKAAGYNVLTIDNRAHGLSDGHFNTLGYKESLDVIAWAKMLHEDLGIRRIFLHGVCIGSSTACYTLTRKECPDYIVGMAGEGMYTCFYETFLTHLKDQGHKPFPMGVMAMLELYLCTGSNVFSDGPKKRLPKLTKPILMIHSKEDIYSLPEKAEIMYETISAEKKMVWFEHGAHSRIRILSEENRKRYDGVIEDFLTNVF